MSPFIRFAEALTASAVLVYILTDSWFTQTVIGNCTLGAVLTVLFFGAYLYGLSDGIRIGQKNHDVLYDIGLQTGKKWRGK